jgi:uncharacterized membrane protein
MKQRLIRTIRAVKYPDLYCWYILASTLDIVTTYVIIEHYEGSEANHIANGIFQRFGWAGMVALKYATVVIVVLVCEAIALRNIRAGRRMAIVAVCIGALPVLLGAIQVYIWVWGNPHAVQPLP